jgi:hypothetical protein
MTAKARKKWGIKIIVCILSHQEAAIWVNCEPIWLNNSPKTDTSSRCESRAAAALLGAPQSDFEQHHLGLPVNWVGARLRQAAQGAHFDFRPRTAASAGLIGLTTPGSNPQKQYWRPRFVDCASTTSESPFQG